MSFPNHAELPHVSAQSVVDAIRFVLMAQRDPKEQLALVIWLLDIAPETDGNGGFELLTELLAEGSLKVSVV
jgi:hypothetical protein